MKLPERDLSLLRWSEVERTTSANAGVPFALIALLRGPAVKLLNAAVELLDFLFARKLAFFRRRPASFVESGENEMRPLLSLCLSDGQEVYSCVGMIAGRVTFHTETRRDLLQPSQVQCPREIAFDLARPVPASTRNLHPVLLPIQPRKGVLGRLQEFRKGSARGKEFN